MLLQSAVSSAPAAIWSVPETQTDSKHDNRLFDSPRVHASCGNAGNTVVHSSSFLHSTCQRASMLQSCTHGCKIAYRGASSASCFGKSTDRLMSDHFLQRTASSVLCTWK